MASLASAQSFTPVRELKNLSQEDVARLHSLEELSVLPGGAWRFHAGDLPHGEAPTLEDAGWPSVDMPAPRKPILAPMDAVWYRRVIEIPKTVGGYDITGSRIWFQFQADANGPMPEIIYFNGRRVAIGEDLEPIVLTESAKPGDKILVAVKLLRTVDEKRFRGVSLRIEPPADSTRPSPNDIRTQIIAAANLLPALPKPRPDLLPEVHKAIAAIDFKALEHANQKAFDVSLVKAQAVLATLAPATHTATVDLVGNSHIDAAWLWPASETVDVVKRTFSTALQLMNEYPDYKFSQSASQYSAWMADKYPDIDAQIKQRVKEGRWEIVGGMWIEPDLNLPGGESLVRQLLVGQRVFKNLYDVTARIGWNPDSFGYNWQLPQIYKRSGLDYFVTQKMHWNDTNQLPLRLFWWQSPDGSKVLTYFPTDYAWTNVNPTRLSADYAESSQRNPGTAEHLDLYGVGDHGGGPTRDMLDSAEHWMALSKQLTALPNFRFTTAQQYFDNVQTKLSANSPVLNYDNVLSYKPAAPDANGNLSIPTWNDELYFEYHRGIYTTQAKHKAFMRRTEAETLDAEKLASFAWLFGQKYPAEELTENWKKITFNQFHDLAAGSGVATIYRDAAKDYKEVLNQDALINEGAIKQIAAQVNTQVPVGGPIVVFNPLPWERKDIVRVDVLPEGSTGDQFGDYSPTSGGIVPSRVVDGGALVEVRVPALGYTVIHPQKGCGKLSCTALTRNFLPVNESADEITVSNSSSELSIDKKNGCITHLRIDGGKREMLAQGCSNQLQAFADNPKNYDAWNIDPGTLDKAPEIIAKADSVRVVHADGLGFVVRVQYTYNKSHITQDISMTNYADTVVIDTTIDWHEKHVLLKAAFPLAATAPKATYEIPYGSIQRPTTRDNSYQKAQFEVPALQWADLGDAKQGVSILNDSKYGYDAVGNVLRLTLLRSPTWPDADADQGIQHFRYAIYPHTGEWHKSDTIRRAYELNQPLIATQTFAHTGNLPAEMSFVSVDQPNVILTAVKKAEDADALVFRMYEAEGKATTVTLHIPQGASGAREVNLMESPQGALPLAKDTITVPIKPYEILTVEAAYPKK
ncbi:glycoside hydrolase family 38 C-terminal domain-containing protein [Granulicella cerasi]|uniref:Glycoside hydrolase family 38 C-terminal domain-containing protein n=1 Tax=Granulicella cerasi TaxID=741063 RepID=A0ABW1ZDW0_9BACT